jgi:hypothetical protein
LEALKARNMESSYENVNDWRSCQHYFALSALTKRQPSLPGPMAQAFTFRAFGAETPALQSRANMRQ